MLYTFGELGRGAAEDFLAPETQYWMVIPFILILRRIILNVNYQSLYHKFQSVIWISVCYDSFGSIFIVLYLMVWQQMCPVD